MAHGTRDPRKKKWLDAKTGRWIWRVSVSWCDGEFANGHYEMRGGILYFIENNGTMRPSMRAPRRLRHHKRSRGNGNAAVFGYDRQTIYKMQMASRVHSREKESWWDEA